ncbi:unnamed protein product [Trichogramma brassicae]|uniref:Protein TSSC1 n=1 Tax=Trichogramma brassicae TaxID=86971 RepID=A0A6H5I9Z3_9HYME|nr:unnamed protein product [Trichogramma brassicae]
MVLRQARAWAAQTAETDSVCFFVGTLSNSVTTKYCIFTIKRTLYPIKLKIVSDTKIIIFQHPIEEIWSMQASPTQVVKFITCYNFLTDNTCQMKAALWNIPKNNDTNDIIPLEKLADIDTTPYENELKTITYHPTDSTKAVSVLDNNFVLWDLNFKPQVVTVGTLTSRGQPKFINGKWNSHHLMDQFGTLIKNSIKDLDFNTLRQYYFATCGDDGFMKFWDIRNTNEPVWSIRINKFHDQLVLTSSSDSRVILSNVALIYSEPFNQIHKDNVYAAEWSAADPWTFASLSYDGRLVINRVPQKYKYQILL